MEPYNLPLNIKSSFDLKNKILFSVGGAFLILLSLLCIYIVKESSSLREELLSIFSFIFMLILGLFLLYIVITTDIFRKFNITLNEEGISVSLMFKKNLLDG